MRRAARRSPARRARQSRRDLQRRRATSSQSGFAGSLAAGYSGLFGRPGRQRHLVQRLRLLLLHPCRQRHRRHHQRATGTTASRPATGNDIINSGGGIDVVDGGAGSDLWGADMSFATEDIVIDLNGSSTFLGTGSVVNVEGFAALVDRPGDDQLTSTRRRLAEPSTPAPATTRSRCTDRHRGRASKTVAGGDGSDRLVLTVTGVVTSPLNAPTGDLATGYSGIVRRPRRRRRHSPGSRASPTRIRNLQWQRRHHHDAATATTSSRPAP